MTLKSAWERAMERTGGAAAELSADQKAQLAEMEKYYTAKIAELEIIEKPKIAAAPSPEEAEKIADHLRRSIQKLRDEWEQKRAAIRQRAKT